MQRRHFDRVVISVGTGHGSLSVSELLRIAV
jgi:hypothetical protein